MAWIELHQAVRDHRKIVYLAELLEMPEPHVVGHLTYLWLWALDNAPDGQLDCSDRTIARAAWWEGDPHRLVSALIECGLLERVADTLVIHDWDDYAGKLIGQRRANAERQAKYRERTRPDRDVTPEDGTSDGDVTVTSPSRNGATEQYPTVPNPTEPDQTGERQRAPAREKPPRPATGFERFWDRYPRKTGKQDAERAFAKLDPPAEMLAQMLAAIDRQQTWQQWQDGYIPHPATWLNGKRWLDEEPPRRSNGNGRASPAHEPNPFDVVRERNGLPPKRTAPRDNEIETQGVVLS